MKIGMALSGGGYRATVFHLGVLTWFANRGHLGDVSFLSTVSGGSICAGLIFAVSGNRWPDDDQFLNATLPKIRQLMINVDLQRDLIVRSILSPLQVFQTRADDLADLMEKKFDMAGTLQDLPDEPRWIVNTACYETGKLFSIQKRRMGDYTIGYVRTPDLKVSSAVAGSAGFPIGIGPLELRPADYEWFDFKNGVLSQPIDTPDFDKLHLWDGGVYDNLGDEPLFDPEVGWRDGIDFLVVSDAAGLFKPETYRFGVSPLKRLLDISVSQVRAVRARSLVEHMKRKPGTGMLLHIDNTVRSIVDEAIVSGNLPSAPTDKALDRVLDDKDVREASTMPTHIHDLRAAEFDLLHRQGFEVANATYFGYIDHSAWLHYSR